MKLQLPPLPFAADALEPVISTRTLSYHHGKHLAAYINTTNRLVAGTPLEDTILEQIVCQSDGALFNNAAQAWNHIFYFAALAPEHGSAPEGEILQAIEKKWRSFEHFQAEFVNEGVDQFGSGWVWLVKKADGSLDIRKTANAATPLILNGITPLLTFDVWEHAYYLDYQNCREEYLRALWKVVNWAVVAERYQTSR